MKAVGRRRDEGTKRALNLKKVIQREGKERELSNSGHPLPLPLLHLLVWPSSAVNVPSLPDREVFLPLPLLPTCVPQQRGYIVRSSSSSAAPPLPPASTFFDCPFFVSFEQTHNFFRFLTFTCRRQTHIIGYRRELTSFRRISFSSRYPTLVCRLKTHTHTLCAVSEFD